jgi:hypothetical protein
MRPLLLLPLLLLALALPSTASAYIDGGTGSVVLQTIIGLAAAVGIFLKVFWHKLVSFFSKSAPAEGNPTATRENDQAGS